MSGWASFELLARRFKNKRKARSSSEQFVCREKIVGKSGRGSDFRLTVFANEESSLEPVICSLRLTLPTSPSHFRENLIAFCPLEFFVLSLRLPQRYDKISFALLFFSFFFLLKEASAKFSKCASRAPAWYRYAVRKDPPRLLQRFNGWRSICVGSRAKHFRSIFDLESLASWLGSRRPSPCRSLTALSITQRGFFTGVEHSGPSQVLENVGLIRK